MFPFMEAVWLLIFIRSKTFGEYLAGTDFRLKPGRREVCFKNRSAGQFDRVPLRGASWQGLALVAFPFVGPRSKVVLGMAARSAEEGPAPGDSDGNQKIGFWSVAPPSYLCNIQMDSWGHFFGSDGSPHGGLPALSSYKEQVLREISLMRSPSSVPSGSLILEGARRSGDICPERTSG